MIDSLDNVVRIAGAGGLAVAWVAAGLGAGRGRQRPVGRGIGLAPRWGALGSYLLVAIPYFTIWVVLWSPLPGTPPDWLRLGSLAMGTACGAAGLALYLWGRFTLGDMYNVSSSLGTELYVGHQLVTAGPFRYVRHPMYVGIGLAAVGGLAVYRTWSMVFAVASVAGLGIKARNEEQLLAAEFGSRWSDYAQHVPASIPRIGMLRGQDESLKGGLSHD